MNTKNRRKKTINADENRIGIDSRNHDRDINHIVAEVNSIASHARETLKRCAKKSMLYEEELKLRIEVGVHDLYTIKQVLAPLENLIHS